MADNFGGKTLSMQSAIKALDQHATFLNTISRQHWWPRITYDMFSGGLVWSDEFRPGGPPDVISSLRFLWAYRTSLMQGEPRADFQPIWEHGLQLCPRWIGFRPDRRRPTPKLLKIYRRGEVTSRRCLRKLERDLELAP